MHSTKSQSVRSAVGPPLEDECVLGLSSAKRRKVIAPSVTRNQSINTSPSTQAPLLNPDACTPTRSATSVSPRLPLPMSAVLLEESVVEPEPHPPLALPQQEAPSNTPQAVVDEAAPCVVTTPIKPPHHVRRGKSVQGDSQHEPCSTPDMPASTTLLSDSPACTGT